jgi:polyhydroxyalkanoate synthesis regulator protein
MEMFERAFTMFAPFARREAQAGKGDQAAETEKPPGPGGEIDDLKRQLDDVQKRLDRLSETKG